MAYQLIDTHTGKLIKVYPSRVQAAKRRDQLDSQYGAVRYVVRPVAAS